MNTSFHVLIVMQFPICAEDSDHLNFTGSLLTVVQAVRMRVVLTSQPVQLSLFSAL